MISVMELVHGKDEKVARPEEEEEETNPQL